MRQPTHGTASEAAGQRMTRPRDFSSLLRAPFLPAAGCALALLSLAGLANAQGPQGAPLRAAATAAPTQTVPPQPVTSTVPAGISYIGGQLRINALNTTLADVLVKVAALTGVTIDIPPGAQSEKLPVVELGPGPAREVVAALLSDSNFDYLIQSSNTDANKLGSVMVLAREKKGSGPTVADASPRQSRSPFVRAAAPPEPPPETSAPAQPEIAAQEAAILNAPPAIAPADQSAALAPVPDAALQLPSGLQPAPPDVSGSARPGALSPPSTLNQQNINQQLQLMYQQRMQIQAPGTQVNSASPGGK